MNNSIYSPVKFTSPSSYKSPKANPSAALANQRLLLIVKQLLADYEKWNELQKRGLVVCYSIERLKTKPIEATSNVVSLYPEEMNSGCEKLRLIVDNFRTIRIYCTEARKQIEGLKQLNSGSIEPIYKTWNFDDFLEFIDKIGDRYEQELEIKRIVMENIAHATTKAMLVMHVSVWEYPMYVNFEMNLLFAILAKECL